MSQYTNEHKHLGLLLSDDMQWSKHVKCCLLSANRRLGMLYRLRWYVTRQHMESIYLNIIRPALEYGAIKYDSCTLTDSFSARQCSQESGINLHGRIETNHNCQSYE